MENQFAALEEWMRKKGLDKFQIFLMPGTVLVNANGMSLDVWASAPSLELALGKIASKAYGEHP